MATPPNTPESKRKSTEKSIKHASGLVNVSEATTVTPAFSDDVTTTTPAVGDDFLSAPAHTGDPLGSGRLEAGRSEPSSPNAVIGPITKRRARTAPYVEQSDAPADAAGVDGKAPKPKKSLARRILKGVLWTSVAAS